MSFFAHSQIEIRGTVKGSSNVVNEFDNVMLTNQANEIITGTITDEKGFFNLSIKEGTYTLTISFLGYSDWVRNVSINQSVDFRQVVVGVILSYILPWIGMICFVIVALMWIIPDKRIENNIDKKNKDSINTPIILTKMVLGSK